MWLKQIFSRHKIELSWQGFSLSQTHSCADYIFWYDVRTDEKGRLRLTGECRNDDGEPFSNEKGIRLKRRTVTALLALELEKLPAVRPAATQPVFLLDATEQCFSLSLPDGTSEQREIPEAVFSAVADQLKAYLIKS